MGYKAVIVEGTQKIIGLVDLLAADHNILPGNTVNLPHISCLMVKELVPGALMNIRGIVDYSFYNILLEEW